MEPNVVLTCSVCQKSFLRQAKYHRRNIQRGRNKFYCGLSCAAKVKNHLQVFNENRSFIEKHFSPNWGRGRADEFSPFRYYVRQAKLPERIKLYGESDITVEYLKMIWEKQKGKCAYTGIPLVLSKTTRDHHVKANTPYKASLDRIDSSKGYIQGNVEFVCLAVNLAKSSFSKQVMLDFFIQVKQNYSIVL